MMSSPEPVASLIPSKLRRMTLVKGLERLGWLWLFAHWQRRPEFSKVIYLHFLQYIVTHLAFPSRCGVRGNLSFEDRGTLRHGFHRKVFIVTMLDDERQNFLRNPVHVSLDRLGHLGRWNIETLLSNEKTNVVGQLLVEIGELIRDLRFDVNRENSSVRGSRINVFVKKGKKFVFRNRLDVLDIGLI
jgi:hypothetical protein